MSVKSITYLANTALNTERGPSEAIWGLPGNVNAGPEDFIQDPRLGMYTWDEFDVTGSPGLYPSTALITASLGKWGFLGPIGGGATDGAIVGGGLTLSPGSLAVSSTNQTAAVLFSQVGGYQVTANSSGNSALQGKIAFEARVMLSSVTASKRDAFVGLCDQTPLSSAALQCLLPFTVVSGGTANALTSTRNLIGFYAPSSTNTEWGFVFQLASTAAVICSNLQSLVSKVTGTAIAAGTFYKLGFVYDPNAVAQQISSASDGQTAGTLAKAMLSVYVNGVKAAAFLTQTQNILTASFPTGIMGPIAAIVPSSSGANSGSTQSGTMTVDWIRIGQNMIA